MKRTYTLILDVEGPDDTDVLLLDGVVANVIEWSTAKEAIDTGIFGTCDHLNVNVTSLRLSRPDDEEDEEDEEYVARCPACGDPIDYCQGHGEMGDPAGFAILAAHDGDDHSECHPDGCESSRNSQDDRRDR